MKQVGTLIQIRDTSANVTVYFTLEFDRSIRSQESEKARLFVFTLIRKISDASVTSIRMDY